jgi:hypothetical protein
MLWTRQTFPCLLQLLSDHLREGMIWEPPKLNQVLTNQCETRQLQHSFVHAPERQMYLWHDDHNRSLETFTAMQRLNNQVSTERDQYNTVKELYNRVTSLWSGRSYLMWTNTDAFIHSPLSNHLQSRSISTEQLIKNQPTEVHQYVCYNKSKYLYRSLIHGYLFKH